MNGTTTTTTTAAPMNTTTMMPMTTAPPTTSTTTTAAPPTTTTTTATTTAAPQTTIRPATTGLTWVKNPYNLSSSKGGTSAATQGSDAANQQYTLNAGYNCFVYDGAQTIYPRTQGNPDTGKTLIAYKNSTYYSTPNTSVNFGPVSTTPFTNQTLGNVLASIKSSATNNIVLLNSVVSPTAPSSTVVSGTYSNDQAMLNVSSDQSFYTWFYGGTTFPYSYTMTSFTPSST